MRGKSHSQERKTQAIAMLMAGESVSDVARNLGLPDSTVRTWSRSLGDDFTMLRDKKGDKVVNLLEETLVKTIESNLDQLATFSDREWLYKQSAGDMAILHGTLFDKACRILNLVQPGDSE